MKFIFTFELDKKYISHIKERSSYNHNYYKLDTTHYGDYILPAKCDVLYIEVEDDCYEAYYTLGYFNDKGDFEAMWTWLDEFKYDL